MPRKRKKADLPPSEPVQVAEPVEQVVQTLPEPVADAPPAAQEVVPHEPPPARKENWPYVQHLGDGFMRMKLVDKRPNRLHLQIRFDDSVKPDRATKEKLQENGWKYWPKGGDWAWENWVFPLDERTRYRDMVEQEKLFKELASDIRAENGIGQAR